MHNLKQIFRLILKHKRSTLLSICSLFIGLCAFVLISAKINYHLSFDKHFDGYEDIYRVVTSVITDNIVTVSEPRSQRALGKTLQEQYPEVKQSAYLCGAVQNNFRIGENTFINKNAYHCSNDFLDLFSIEILQGETEGVLDAPYVAIVSESFAKKYLGSKNPIDEIIHQFPAGQIKIVGIYKDLPSNTHFHADFLMSFHDNMHLPPPLKENWGEYSFYNYLKLDHKADIKKLEKAMTQISMEHQSGFFKNSRTEYKYELQPLTDIHTLSNLKNEISKNISREYLTILQLVSILILIAAGLNYVYFSHTRFTSNSLKYGIQKTLGANNRSLFLNFLTESILIHVVAFTIVLFVVSLIKQYPLLSEGINEINQTGSTFLIKLFILFIASAVINPSMLLILIYRKSSLSLLNKIESKKKLGFSYRQFLTVIQFVVIIFLITSILGITKQVKYLTEKDKGINIENKLVIKTPQNLRRTSSRLVNLNAFEQELQKMPGVNHMAISNNVPGDITTFGFSVSETQNSNGIKTALFIADKSFVESYEIEIVGGSNFSVERDNSGSIINESCMKQLGYENPKDIIGKKLFMQDESGLQQFETTIIGICNDFNFSSVKELPGPIILLDWTKEIMWSNYTLSLTPNADKEMIISNAEKYFRKTFPNYSFEYFWVDDFYNQQFEEEQTINNHLKIFALIALLLGILSMFSMVWHISLARTKEIGIRKVNGAKKSNIVWMLNFDFLKWILVSGLLAIPFSWIFLSKWLHNFSYQVQLGFGIFILSIIGVMLVGFLTATWQSFKVAKMNPVKSLKYE